jgi:CRP-like cAMP-binding protein
MIDESISPLAPMLRKLDERRTLSAADHEAVLALPHRLETIPAHRSVVREGEVATHSCLLRSGIAFRQKVTGDGKRQICSIHLSGDMVDLQNSLLWVADHSVVALTPIKVAFIPREAILDLSFAHRSVGEAMWFDTLVDGSVFREWLTSAGQRNARTRVAHLLCEFGLRFEQAGLGTASNYELPMSQEFLGDCTGLTAVHVNRMLRSLKDEGLLTMTKGWVKILDWAGLAKAGEFDRLYLHLPENQKAAFRKP